jgi:hypothetical protein
LGVYIFVCWDIHCIFDELSGEFFFSSDVSVIADILLFIRILLTLPGSVVNLNSTGEAKGVQTTIILLAMVAELVVETIPHQTMHPLEGFCRRVLSVRKFHLQRMMMTKDQ